MAYYDYNLIDTVVKNEDAIKQSITNILLTRRGSLPGKPRFGSDLYKILFNPMDHITKHAASTYIMDALSEFEPRIKIIDISIKDIPEYNRIILTLTYQYKLDGDVIESSVNIKLKD